MGMLQEMERELKRRRIAAMEAELSARKKAVTGTPNIIEEQHSGISNADRAILKNLGKDANSNASYIAKNNPQLDTRVWDGRVLVKGKDEKDWRTLDPDADGFDGFGELAKDIGDVVYDVGSGIVEGVGTAVVTGASAFPSGGALAIPAAAATYGGLSAASEAARQQFGKWAGVNDEISTDDVITAGVIGGALPFAPGAAKSVAKGAKNTLKGAAKFLTGADDKAIKRMQQDGAEEFIQKAEKESITPMIREAAEKRRSAISRSEQAQIDRVEALKGNFKIDDDEQLKDYLNAEIQALSKKGDFGPRRGKLERAMADIDDTKAVRSQIKSLGVDDPTALRRGAFPESVGLEDIKQMTPEINDKLQANFKAIQDEYQALKGAGEDVSLESVKKLYKTKIDNLMATGDLGDEATAKALKMDYNNKLMQRNPDYKSIDINANQRSNKTIDKPDITKYEKASSLKKKISDEAYTNTQAIKSGIKTKENLGGIVAHQQQAERLLNEEMKKSSVGLKGELDPKFKEMIDGQKLAKKLFGDEMKAESTLRKALQSKDSAKLVRDQVKHIDDLAGTNYSKMINETIEAESLTKKAIDQSKLASESSEFAKALAEKNKPAREKMLEQYKAAFGDDKSFESTVEAYRAKVSNVFNDDIDEIDKLYGDEIGDAVADMADNMDFLSAFGDTAKTKVKRVNKGEAANTLRGISQAAGWNLPVVGGAGVAQVTGAAGKAIGDKIPVRQFLRKNLPKYMKKKQAYIELDAKAKAELEKKVMDTMFRRRDLIRELSKSMATDKSE